MNNMLVFGAFFYTDQSNEKLLKVDRLPDQPRDEFSNVNQEFSTSNKPLLDENMIQIELAPQIQEVFKNCSNCVLKNTNFETYIKQVMGNISDAAILVSPEKIEKIDEAEQKLLQYQLENKYES